MWLSRCIAGIGQGLAKAFTSQLPHPRTRATAQEGCHSQLEWKGTCHALRMIMWSPAGYISSGI